MNNGNFRALLRVSCFSFKCGFNGDKRTMLRYAMQGLSSEQIVQEMFELVNPIRFYRRQMFYNRTPETSSRLSPA